MSFAKKNVVDSKANPGSFAHFATFPGKTYERILEELEIS